jgi:hypothetical protein
MIDYPALTIFACAMLAFLAAMLVLYYLIMDDRRHK